MNQAFNRYAASLCQPKVVLLIDDNADDRELFRLACEGLNIELLDAESGVRGLEILKERPDVGLVLVDARMPGMCGMDVYHAMREMGDRREIVFWTSYARKLAHKLKDAGCARVIAKPSDISRRYVHDMMGQLGVREQLVEAVGA